MTVELQRLILAESLGLVRPVVVAAESAEAAERLVDAIGWNLTAIAGIDMSDLVGAAAELKLGVDKVMTVLDDGPDDLLALATSLPEMARSVAKLAEIGAAWTPPQGLPANTVQLFVEDLLWFLLDLRLQLALPRTHAVLELCGLLVREQGGEITRSDGELVRRAQERPRLDVALVGTLLTDPKGALRDRWALDGQVARDAGAIADSVGPVAARALREFGLHAGYGTPGADADDRFTPDEQQAARRMLHTALLHDGDGAGAGAARLDVVLALTALGGKLVLVVAPFGTLAVQRTLGDWDVTARLQGDVGAIVVKADGVDFEGGATDAHIDLSVSAHRRVSQDGSPLLRLGSPTGTRGEIGGLKLAATVDMRATEATVSGSVELERAFLAIAAGGTDGFLASVLPKQPMVMELELALEWSPQTGLRIRGGTQLEVTLPLNVAFGPVTVPTVGVALRATADETSLELTASPSVKLGPLTAAIERAGIEGRLTPAAGGGALGALGLTVGFKAPTGVGLSIEAAAVSGGGFLTFDPDEEQYAGGVHLQFQAIALNAIGLLTTRLPDGSKGFSLLVIVTASGFTPIQLGFGFTLNGVGGLIGINRTVAVDVLRAGVRSRSLDAILFSRDDPIPRASQIVSALRSVFPPARERFVFGPMAVLGWGSPTVLTFEVAVLLELPAPVRLLVLGRLRALLPGPDEKKAIVKLNMDVLGVLDFGRREVSIDATLYDSSIARFTISGDMALRAGWGDTPGFALSVGGWHPRARVPAGFPALRRVSISLATGDNPRLRLESYLAVTSNTVQFGARLELFVAAGSFSLEGVISFDALVQFAPFELDIELAGRLALKAGGSVLLGVDVRVRLTGPTPWRAQGEATFQLLFFKVTVRFDKTFGAAQALPDPERLEVWPRLREALLDGANWATETPADAAALATVRALPPAAGELLAHPLGRLSVRQRVVPLEREIERFANAPPADHRRFRIAAVSVDGSPREHRPTLEPFAPAQFAELSEAERLVAPGFERMPAGAEVTGDDVLAGPERPVARGFETKIVPADGGPVIIDPEAYVPAAATVAAIAETSAAGVAGLRQRGRGRYASADGPGAVVTEPRFVVAVRDRLAPLPGAPASDGTFSGSREALRRLAAEDARTAANARLATAEELRV